MDHDNGEKVVHIGSGSDVAIRDLAETIKRISGFKGRITFDSSKPDGTMKKLLDNSLLTGLGWQAKVSLEEGIQKTYQWYCKECGKDTSND
jgi:nucleoside-diphosphate-sugar epimerase